MHAQVVCLLVMRYGKRDPWSEEISVASKETSQANPSLGTGCQPRPRVVPGRHKSHMCSRLYCMPVFAMNK